MSALFISTPTAFGKGSDFYSMSKTLSKKNNEYDKKKALTRCLVHNTVLVQVSDSTPGREGKGLRSRWADL